MLTHVGTNNNQKKTRLSAGFSNIKIADYFSGWPVPGLVVFGSLPSSIRPSLRRSRPSWALRWLSGDLPCSFISSLTKPAPSLISPLTLILSPPIASRGAGRDCKQNVRQPVWLPTGTAGEAARRKDPAFKSPVTAAEGLRVGCTESHLPA